MAGRPTKLTPARTERLLQAVRLGAYIEQACEHADIDTDTLYEWLKQGDKALDLAYERLRKLEAEAILAQAEPPKKRKALLAAITPRLQQAMPYDEDQATGTARRGVWKLLNKSGDEIARLAPLAEFSDAYKKASNEAELRALARITEHGKKEWQAAAWLLERRNPERWGRRRLEVVGNAGGPVEGRVTVYLPDNGRT